MTVEPRPTLPEAEYRVRQWLAQHLWGTNYVGRVVDRIVREYDRRGRALGLSAVGVVPAAADEPPAALVDDPAEGTPVAAPHCHNPRSALQCGLCADQPAPAGGGA